MLFISQSLGVTGIIIYEHDLLQFNNIMDSTIPEGAPKNPFHDYVEDYANYTRNYHPTEYRRFGAYAWQQVPEQVKVKVTDSVMNIQTMIWPTIHKLRNSRNISQIQDRVYRKLKVYEDEFNICQMSARSPNESYVCGNILLKRLNEDMPPYIKSVLDEY